MKFLEHKCCIAFLGLMLLQLPVQADDDQPITVEQLPQNAQTLLKNDFSKFKVVYAEMERGARNNKYEVKFSNGGSIEFNKKGEWKEIDCKDSAVPDKFIPQAIRKQIKKRWPEAKITKIEKDHKQYEVEISTGQEITFNKNFKIVDVDD